MAFSGLRDATKDIDFIIPGSDRLDFELSLKSSSGFKFKYYYDIYHNTAKNAGL